MRCCSILVPSKKFTDATSGVCLRNDHAWTRCTHPRYTMPRPEGQQAFSPILCVQNRKSEPQYLKVQYSNREHTSPGRMTYAKSTISDWQTCLILHLHPATKELDSGLWEWSEEGGNNYGTFAWTVTVKAPREQITITLVNTPRDWSAGAYKCTTMRKSRSWTREILVTLMLNMMPRPKQSSSGPHKSQSLSESQSNGDAFLRLPTLEPLGLKIS